MFSYSKHIRVTPVARFLTSPPPFPSLATPMDDVRRRRQSGAIHHHHHHQNESGWRTSAHSDILFRRSRIFSSPRPRAAVGLRPLKAGWHFCWWFQCITWPIASSRERCFMSSHTHPPFGAVVLCVGGGLSLSLVLWFINPLHVQNFAFWMCIKWLLELRVR